MKKSIIAGLPLLALLACNSEENTVNTVGKEAPQTTTTTAKRLFIDVHDLEPGKVKYEDVMGAHKKDLACEGKHGVHFMKFWVDEQQGKVYCLSFADNADSVYNTHKEAHGLVPAGTFEVTAGQEAVAIGNKPLFLDVHELGAGNVTAAAVAEAHVKDLAVQKQYGVNLINYWVDEKQGVVMCLAEAADSSDLVKTHREAHGLLPARVVKVKQGE